MKNLLILIVSGAVLLGGCRPKQNRSGEAAAETDTTEAVVGSDRDAHGCIGSAGYTWSAVRQKCIRPFEIGIKMVSVADPDATSAAYVVFSADSSQAELFLPGTDGTEVLDRRSLPSGGYAWNVEDDDTKNVRQVDGSWVIEQRGHPLYVQDIYPIHAAFDGRDGINEKIYDVKVTFEPGMARLTLDGTVFDLLQYVTADGYGYRSTLMELRGKGRAATLTMRDGLTLTLIQTN